MANSPCITCRDDPLIVFEQECQFFERQAEDQNICGYCRHAKSVHQFSETPKLPRAPTAFVPSEEILFKGDKPVEERVKTLEAQNLKLQRDVGFLLSQNQIQDQKIESLEKKLHNLYLKMCSQTQQNNLNAQLLSLSKSTVVTDPELQKTLSSWLPAHNELTLLYRASKNGFDAFSFHLWCDGKGASVTVIKDTNGNIFGGYTSLAWSSLSSDSYVQRKPDPSAFLFSLSNAQGMPPTVFKVKEPKIAVYHDSNLGPTFGGGRDIYLVSNPQLGKISYANPRSFEYPPNKPFPLTGEKNFQVVDYEVYLLK